MAPKANVPSTPIASLKHALTAAIDDAPIALGVRNKKGTEECLIMHRLVVGKSLPATGEYGPVGTVWQGQTVIRRNNSRFDGIEPAKVEAIKATEDLERAVARARAAGVLPSAE